MNETIIKKINPAKWYRVSDVVDRGWVLNTRGKATKQYVYHHIRIGKLLARDFSSGKFAPLYMVKGQDLIDYIRKTYL